MRNIPVLIALGLCICLAPSRVHASEDEPAAMKPDKAETPPPAVKPVKPAASVKKSPPKAAPKTASAPPAPKKAESEKSIVRDETKSERPAAVASAKGSPEKTAPASAKAPVSVAEKTPAPAATAKTAPAALGSVPLNDDDIRAEIVELPPLKRTPVPIRPPLNKMGALNATAATRKVCSALQPVETGYATVLSGTVDCNLDLGAQQSPILIRGNLLIAEDCTLTLNPGAVIHLRADPKAEKPTRLDVPDPSQSAVIWVWGTLRAEGVTGNPIEMSCLEKTHASLLLYGSSQSRIDGARLKSVTVTQTEGVAQWTNCEFVLANHYALAGGAALFTHCSFKNCGGVFATYNLEPWSLLMRKNVFEGCKEGLVLGSDPGETRLIVEKNHFLRTHGANIRAMPLKDAAASEAAAGSKKSAQILELFIGENWYGSALPELVEPRLVDRRIDPTVAARLNTRPPAEHPYTNVGAGVTPAVLAATLHEQESAQQKLLQAHPSLSGSEKPDPAAMSRGVKKGK